MKQSIYKAIRLSCRMQKKLKLGIKSKRDVVSHIQLRRAWQEIAAISVKPDQWDGLPWREASSGLLHLQRRIYLATQRVKDAKENDKDGLIRKLRKLQTKALFSHDNLIMAVRRVTQINKGRNTAGTDSFLVKTKEDRYRLYLLLRDKINILRWTPSPARRVYILKKNGKLRPLGIPTIVDRVIQAIVKGSLEPEWEAKADIGSYGFRPGRSCHDAIEKIFRTLSKEESSSKQWVVEGDIKGCFDNISHTYLMDKVSNFPARELIHKWLKAGYLDKDTFHSTDVGTPQGGIVSPLLANIALDGMEQELGIRYRKRKAGKEGFRLTLDDYVSKRSQTGRRAFVRYADDFVVLCESEDDAKLAKSQLVEILAKRGLTLSPEKTRITKLTDGIDFLGVNIREFKVNKNVHGERGVKIQGSKLLITPSSKSLISIRDKLKELFTAARGKHVGWLISKVNPVIRGWANYHRPFSSRKAFEALDSYLFQLQKRYVYRTHLNKGWKWRMSRYFGNLNQTRPEDIWVFGDKKLDGDKPTPVKPTLNKGKSKTESASFMLKFRWITIRRHEMIPNGYSIYDPSLA